MLEKSICETCVTSSVSATELKSHILLHHIHGVFLCDVCNKVLRNNVDIQLHVDGHVAEKCRTSSFYDAERSANSAEPTEDVTSHFVDIKRELLDASADDLGVAASWDAGIARYSVERVWFDPMRMYSLERVLRTKQLKVSSVSS